MVFPGPKPSSVTVIEPSSGFQSIDFRELIEYRDLFAFLIWRNIKVMYAQTVLGFSWAILNPVIQILVFTIVFGQVAKLNTDGIPYVLFSTVAVVPWTYMTEAMTLSSQSLVAGQNMLGKIYFPRLIFPITPILSKLVDFGIAMTLVIGVMVYYQVALSWNLLFLPLFVVMMMAIAAGAGMWLAALAIRYRDVKFAIPFVLRMLIYTAPIVYSSSAIPESYRIWYSLNPIVGAIEGFRGCLLGTALEWQYIFPGMVTALILFVSGTFYFRRMERVFADVI